MTKAVHGNTQPPDPWGEALLLELPSNRPMTRTWPSFSTQLWSCLSRPGHWLPALWHRCLLPGDRLGLRRPPPGCSSCVQAWELSQPGCPHTGIPAQSRAAPLTRHHWKGTTSHLRNELLSPTSSRALGVDAGPRG